ncbi:MAG: hypothetical protein HQL56_01165 [Magnetococcales bacterium]|nr:hypothetical protein [Magnetococcales bacterium]
MPRESIRERLLQEIMASLAHISKQAGYWFDITPEKVFRAERPYRPEDLPVCVVWDGDEVGSKKEYGNQQTALKLTVEMLVSLDGGNASQIANRAIADLRDNIESGDHTIDGLADDLALSNATWGLPEHGSGIVAVAVTYDVTMSSIFGDPTTQP